MISKLISLVLLLFIFFFTGVYLIAQEKSLTLKELCTESSDIIIGTPVAISSHKSQNGKNVYSLIDISVEKTLKGNLEQNSVIRMPMFGGTIDGITTFAVGFPRFSTKVKSIFFLQEKSEPIEALNGPQQIFLITGLSQGKFDIVQDNREQILLRNYEGSLKLENVGKVVSLSKENNVTAVRMISFIKDFLNN